MKVERVVVEGTNQRLLICGNDVAASTHRIDDMDIGDLGPPLEIEGFEPTPPEKEVCIHVNGIFAWKDLEWLLEAKHE